MQQIWPFDHTPITIQRVLVKYHWVKCVTNKKKRVMVIVRFFNLVLETNAERAINRLAPITFSRQEELLRDKIHQAGVVPVVPVPIDLEPEAKSQPAPTPNPPRGGRGGGFRGRGGRGGRARGGRASRGGRGGRGGGNPCPRASAEGLAACYSFNNDPACVNEDMGNNRCRDKSSGDWFIHVCNQWIEGKNSHCLGTHKRGACRGKK